MKNFVISHVFGKHNLGDFAIRNSAIKILSHVTKSEQLFVIAEDIHNFPLLTRNKIKKTFIPYGYAIKTSSKKAHSAYTKTLRLLCLVVGSIILLPIKAILPNAFSKLNAFTYVDWIQKSDALILMGGGYFVTKNKVKDFFGILLNALPLLIARYYKKKIIVLPISFGPFSSTLHESIIGTLLKGQEVMCRDTISLSYIQKYNPRARFVPDLALYDWENVPKKKSKNYIVLTVKDYLKKSEQENVERELTKYILEIWKRNKLHTIFIPTGANPIEENDIPVGNRIFSNVKNPKIFQIVYPKTPEETKLIIKQAKLAICTRMHSAIFSITSFTPFIGLAYEHKTVGLMKFFNLEKWCVDFKTIQKDKLLFLTKELLSYTNYTDFQKILYDKREEVMRYKQQLMTSLMLSLT